MRVSMFFQDTEKYNTVLYMYKACGAFQSNLTNMAMKMNYKIYVWQMSHMKLKKQRLVYGSYICSYILNLTRC